MASLYVSDPELFAPVSDVWRLFVPDRSLERLDGPEHGTGTALIAYAPCTPDEKAVAEVHEEGRGVIRVEDDTSFLALREGAAREKRERIHRTKRAMYLALSRHLGRRMPWGALTGIRPSKLYRELAALHGEEKTTAEFVDTYLVEPDRARLARDLTRVQRPLIADPDTDMAVYIGIPFCPTRCGYCSFVAQDAISARSARDGYLEALLREIHECASIAETHDVRSVYVGGGTPTTLEAWELERLMGAVREVFGGAEEITVEAGRPDTVTSEKLDVLRDAGVDRVCVNPQTTNNATLERIGRRHDTAQYEAAMELAAERFGLVNCDTIAGLPGETPADMARTIQDVLAHAPANVTVHALAVKNAAAFAEDRYGVLPGPEDAEQMIQTASGMLRDAGYRPYYLYRQKYMSGNLENTGWARPGTECLYNIVNMEETGSVLALGAGGISKLVTDGGARIERAANVKDALQYITRVDEMADRKKRLFAHGQTC